MKANSITGKLMLLICLAASTVQICSSQTYDLVNYNINGTPVYGVKIKTNIPFTNSGSMPTIHIEGYNYASPSPIGIDIVWYVFNGTFTRATASSWGGYTPSIYLSEESGLINIFIDDRSYFQRFHVSAYAKGMSAENTTSFSGWTVVDDSLSGDHQLLVPYQNRFKGIVSVDGNVLVGKTTQANPDYKLDVNGDVRANKVVVNTTGADYVFDSSYSLPKLDTLDKYIRMHRHLPGIPSAGQMQNEGLDVGANQTMLLQKMEELTLYLIRQNGLIERQSKVIDDLTKRMAQLEHGIKISK